MHHIYRHIIAVVLSVLWHVLGHGNLGWNLLRCHQPNLRSLRSELDLRQAWVLKRSKSGPCLRQLIPAPSNPLINATGRPTGPELFTLEPRESLLIHEDIGLSNKLLTATATTIPQAYANVVKNSNKYEDGNNLHASNGLRFCRHCFRPCLA